MLQHAFTAVVTGGNWADLGQWDVALYADVVEHGFHVPLPSVAEGVSLPSVGFFPGHILWGALFHYGLGLATPAALILASQVAAIGFWTCFGWMLRAVGLSAESALAVCFALLLQPGALYLINGHSEALFLWGLAGFVLWTELGLRRWPWLIVAALHGAVMTGTRFVGIAVVAYPLLRVALDHWVERGRSAFPWRRLGAGLATAAGALTGAGAFFLYCQMAFGRWDLYMETERVLAKTYVDWSKVFWPTELFSFTLSGTQPTGTGKFLTLVAIGVGLWLLWVTIRRARTRSWMLAMVLTGGLLLGDTLAGRSSAGYFGMIRHLLPVTALFLPVLGSLAQERWRDASLSSGARVRWVVAASVVALLLGGLHAVYLYRYVHGLWVA